MPSTTATTIGTTAQVLPQTGLRGWLSGLSPRDRAIYGFLLALLVVIVGIYAAVGFQLLTGNRAFGNVSPFAPIEAPSETTTVQTATPTEATATSSPAPSETPTRTSVTPSRTSVTPSRTPRTSTATPAFIPPQQPLPIPTVTVGVISTETPGVVPDSTPDVTPDTPPNETPDASPDDTPGLPTGTPADGAATATPEPADTTEPVQVEPTAPGEDASPVPDIPTDEAQPLPTQPGERPTGEPRGTSEVSFGQQELMLYFADSSTNTMLVPITRVVSVRASQVATAAVRELIEGPQGRLTPVIHPEAHLLPEGVQRRGSTITVNFDRDPTPDWDTAGYGLTAIALTLTELPGVNQIQVQVDGQNIGLGPAGEPITRPIVNPDNPDGLSTSFSSGTRFLPLYFNNGEYTVRITRLVPRTPEIARATVTELLDGPEQYDDRLASAIPRDTRLSSIRREGRRAIVDLTTPFIASQDRQGAVDALVLSLTELRDAQQEAIFVQVDIFVDGQPLVNYWGEDFRGPFERPDINAE